MKPLIHAKISVKRHGGHVDDYLPIHTFIDSSKSSFADVRHRAILHSSFGCFLTEQVFGPYITNSDGEMVSTRDIAEGHISDDMGGWIPSIQDWLKNLPLEDWMHNKKKRTVTQIQIDKD